MPAWDEYKKIARERGALAFELYVVDTKPVKDPSELQATLPDHLAYQKELEAAGKLFMAGPVSDDTGEQMFGSGLMIYRASSMDEAKALADGDPMHAKGVREYTLRKWLVNEGSPSFSTALSDKRIILS